MWYDPDSSLTHLMSDINESTRWLVRVIWVTSQPSSWKTFLFSIKIDNQTDFGVQSRKQSMCLLGWQADLKEFLLFKLGVETHLSCSVQGRNATSRELQNTTYVSIVTVSLSLEKIVFWMKTKQTFLGLNKKKKGVLIQWLGSRKKEEESKKN